MATTFSYHNNDDKAGDPFSQKTRTSIQELNARYYRIVKGINRGKKKDFSNEMKVFEHFLENRLACVSLDDATMIDHLGGWVVNTLIPSLTEFQRYSSGFDIKKAEERLDKVPDAIESYTKCMLLMGQRRVREDCLCA